MDPEATRRLRELIDRNPQAAEALNAIVSSEQEAGLDPSAKEALRRLPAFDQDFDKAIDQGAQHMERPPAPPPPPGPEEGSFDDVLARSARYMEREPGEGVPFPDKLNEVTVEALPPVIEPRQAELGEAKLRGSAALDKPGRIVAEVGEGKTYAPIEDEYFEPAQIEEARTFLSPPRHREIDFEDDFTPKEVAAAGVESPHRLGNPRGALAKQGADEVNEEEDVERDETADGPDYDTGRRMRILAAVLNAIAPGSGELANKRADMYDKRAEAAFKRARRRRKIGSDIGDVTGLPAEMPEEDAELAVRLGRQKPTEDPRAAWEWKSRENELDRQNKLAIQELRNKGRRRKGGRGLGLPPSPELTPEEAQRLEQLEQLYSGGNSSVLPELTALERKAHGEKIAYKQIGALRSNSNLQQGEEHRLARSDMKFQEQMSWARGAVSRIKDLTTSWGPSRVTAAAKEVVSPAGLSGGELSGDAALLRTRLLEMMGQIAAIKGGKALTETELEMMGGGGRVALLRDKLDPEDMPSWDPKTWLRSGVGAKTLNALRGAVTERDIYQFLESAPKVVAYIERDHAQHNPTALSRRHRAGDDMSEAVEEAFVNAHGHELEDDTDVEVIGPIEGSNTQWWVSVDGAKPVLFTME